MVLINNNNVQKINRTMAIPLNQLQSLRDRNPRGITFGYATRDHCFVIASEGVIKKESRSSLFLLLPLNSGVGFR